MQDQRSQLDSKRAVMQSTLAQANAAALEYSQVGEALKAKVDHSRQGWEQATNELKRQLEGVLNEVTGPSSHRAKLEKLVEDLKGLEGKVLNCDQVTTSMVEKILRIGLNFKDAEKWVHGVEAMVGSHKASISQRINQVHNLEHPAVSSTATREVEEAKVPATEVRRIAANLEIRSAQVTTLTGQMHHWETVPKLESTKVKALELQVRLLMARLDKNEHEVHAIREEIRTRPHGSPAEETRPDSHVIGDLQRKLESLENKYQLLKQAGMPLVNPIGILTPKPERVRVFGVPAREERVAGSLPGFGFPLAEDDWSSMRSDKRRFRGRAPRGGRSGNRIHEGHTPLGMGGDWRHCAGLDLRYFEADSDGWFLPGMAFQLFNRQESLKDGIGLPKLKPLGILRAIRIGEVCPEDFWMPRSTGRSPKLKERIRG